MERGERRKRSSGEERQWRPWLVPVILVANIFVFVALMFVNNCPQRNSPFGACVPAFFNRMAFQPLRENPLLGPSSNTLEKMGALERDLVIHEGEGWRLVTSIWLHAGLLHLLANMLSLLFIGIRLEQQFGFARIGILYIVSGLGGNILSALFINNSISVGASGALFGLLGAMLAELFTNWTIYSNKMAALVTLVVIIAINLAVGILPHVDNFAHIGGFLTGFFLGFVLLIRPQFRYMERHNLPTSSRGRSKYMTYQYVLWTGGLVLVVAELVVGLILLFKGVNGNDHCSWCHYLSCVPTSKWNCKN